MAVTFSWENSEKTILRFAYHGTWTWDELTQARQQAQYEVGERSIVGVIMDMREAASLPQQAFGVQAQSPYGLQLQDVPKVIVGADPKLQALNAPVHQLNRRNLMQEQLHFAESLTEARYILEVNHLEGQLAV